MIPHPEGKLTMSEQIKTTNIAILRIDFSNFYITPLE
jgi:hypothetical protein